MPAPTDRKYLESHEWHRQDGDLIVVGITQFAADELTDITYVALPEVGKKVSAGKKFGDIESVKTTADLMVGVSGEVVEVNKALASDPGLVNRDPYAGGWMIKVRPASAAGEMDKLLDAAEYLKRTGHE